MTTFHTRQRLPRQPAAGPDAEPVPASQPAPTAPSARPAHAAPADDGGLDAARGIVRAVVWGLAIWALAGLAVVYLVYG
jgi:hypothetical protein